MEAVVTTTPTTPQGPQSLGCAAPLPATEPVTEPAPAPAATDAPAVAPADPGPTKPAPKPRAPGKGKRPASPTPRNGKADPKGKGKADPKPEPKPAAPAKPKADLTEREAAVLAILAKADKPLTRADLAAKTGMAKGWSKLLGAATKDDPGGMQGRRLVKVEAPADSRELHYVITAAGRAALAKHTAAGREGV